MSYFLDEIVELLKDGKEHKLKDITEELKKKTLCNDEQIATALSFLRKYQFIKVNWYLGLCSLTSSTIRFLRGLEKAIVHESEKTTNSHS